MSEKGERSYHDAANENILIFACSGGADVGHLSDQVARLMMKEGCGKMFCLAGIGGHVDGIMKTTRDADRILVIDGCQVDCARKTLEANGITDFIPFQITGLGFDKGKTEVNPETVARAAAHIKQKL
jgi:uncharacterized metal-binding protein